MRVAGLLVDEGAVDVVGPDGGEGADVAGHAGHEAGDQRGDAEAEQAGAAVADQHQRQHFVVAVLAGGLGDVLGDEVHDAAVGVLEHGEGEQAGDDDDEGHRHLEGGADDRSHLGGAQVVGAEHALDDEEVGGPVAEADDEAEAEDDAGPVHAHGVVLEVAERGPHVGVVAVADVDGDLRLEVGPAAGFDEAEDGDHGGAGPDEDELQHLVDDGRAQAAEHDVERDGAGADPDGEGDVPAEDGLHDHGHGVHVDAAHEDGHEREGDRREQRGRPRRSAGAGSRGRSGSSRCSRRAS